MIARSQVTRFLKRLVKPEDPTNEIAVADSDNSLAREHGQTLNIWRPPVMTPFSILRSARDRLSFGPVGVREHQVVSSLSHPSDEVSSIGIGELVVDEALEVKISCIRPCDMCMLPWGILLHPGGCETPHPRPS